MGRRDEIAKMKILEAARFKQLKEIKRMAQPIAVGDWVRAEWKGHQPVVGEVIEEVINENGEFWVIMTRKGVERFRKSHCQVRRRDEISKESKKAVDKARPRPKPTSFKDIFGDGDI